MNYAFGVSIIYCSDYFYHERSGFSLAKRPRFLNACDDVLSFNKFVNYIKIEIIFETLFNSYDWRVIQGLGEINFAEDLF